MNVLFLVPAPLNMSPGQRFRFEHYLPELKKNNINYTLQSFWSMKAWNVLFSKGYIFLKTTELLRGFFRRLYAIITITKYDYVFVYREAAPIGPPFFEWLIAKVFRKKVIYDFDDAIWVSSSSSANPYASLIKCSWKVKYICRYSHIISVGNQFLAMYARRYNNNVKILPTVVNTNVHNKLKDQSETPLTIGWTGTFTNFKNLSKASSVIYELQKKYNFQYLIIADKDPELKDVKYIFKKWKLNTEIEDLLCMNIGIMPLNNSEIESGKCGFKAIQYMSLGIPAVVSPVGINRELVKDGYNGFQAETDEQWYQSLEKLLCDKELRIKLGSSHREFIQKNYSVSATTDLFISLFK